MNTYEHSVSLDVSKCTGCTMCLKRCPTEAIRIHDGHAEIDPERCIDCGVCIRHCPNNAKKATYSKLDSVMKYKLLIQYCQLIQIIHRNLLQCLLHHYQ